MTAFIQRISSSVLRSRAFLSSSCSPSLSSSSSLRFSLSKTALRTNTIIKRSYNTTLNSSNGICRSSIISPSSSVSSSSLFCLRRSFAAAATGGEDDADDGPYATVATPLPLTLTTQVALQVCIYTCMYIERETKRKTPNANKFQYKHLLP